MAGKRGPRPLPVAPEGFEHVTTDQLRVDETVLVCEPGDDPYTARVCALSKGGWHVTLRMWWRERSSDTRWLLTSSGTSHDQTDVYPPAGWATLTIRLMVPQTDDELRRGDAVHTCVDCTRTLLYETLSQDCGDQRDEVIGHLRALFSAFMKDRPVSPA